jgi:plastocyanin
MVRTSRSIGRSTVLLGVAALAACGSDDGGGSYSPGGPDPAALSAARAEPSGDRQSAAPGEELANPLRIVVLRGATPEAGAVVTWSASGSGALLSPGVDTTGADGIATSIWRLGSEAGAHTAQAAVAGADGSPVRFTATAAVDPGPAPSPVEIQLRSSGGDRFEPANVTIPAGTTVTWNWVDGFHNVTPTGNPTFTGSGNPTGAPRTFSQTFTTPGTYLYFCVVHGTSSSGMRGTIVVQ